MRESYKEKVRTAARKLEETPGAKLPLDRKIYEVLDSSTEDKIYQCIGGVCTFLRDNVDKELFKGANKWDTPYSNYTFETDAKKLGWTAYDMKGPVKPEVGDIIQAINPRSRHAMLIVDYDEKKGYKVLDNAGKEDARFR